jgi:hypothetical protein
MSTQSFIPSRLTILCRDKLREGSYHSGQVTIFINSVATERGHPCPPEREA